MATTEATILERIIEPEKADLPPEVARYLLTLDFPQADRRRMEELHARAREAPARRRGCTPLLSLLRPPLPGRIHFSLTVGQFQPS